MGLTFRYETCPPRHLHLLHCFGVSLGSKPGLAKEVYIVLKRDSRRSGIEGLDMIAS